MTTEWMPTKKWAIEILDLLVGDKWEDDAITIAIEAQKKLLEWLIKTHSVAFIDIDGHTVESIRTSHLESMLSQLEAIK